MKKLIFTIVFAGLCAVNSFSQIPKEPTVALTPNAAGLGRYGGNEVSLFTGRPRIEIPLYTLEDNGLSLPIYLSYDASGVRPDQRPGWVGLNWSLHAGGVISRLVKGVPDEQPYPINGYYSFFGILNREDWNELSYLRSVAQYQDHYSLVYDTEPDEFYFNFLDYSGKFYQTHEGDWAVACDKDIKIEFDGEFIAIPSEFKSPKLSLDKYFPSFGNFIITDDNGIRYTFGDVTDAIEYATSFFDQNTGFWYATSWYLTSIKFPNNEEISFRYERGEFDSQLYMAISYDLGSFTMGGPDAALFSLGYNCEGERIGNKSPYSGQLTAPVYLTEITTSKNKVCFSREIKNDMRYDDFFYDDKIYEMGGYSKGLLSILETQMGLIPIYNLHNVLSVLKTYKLTGVNITDKHNSRMNKVFHFEYLENSAQRLMLTSLKEDDNPPFRFYYDNTHRLPGYFANMTDHWGYFNNDFAPIGIFYIGTYYSHKEANTSTAKYGILNKIEYPTGGYTDYYYEPHTYSGVYVRDSMLVRPTGLKYAGGLRVKKIVDRPSGDSGREYVREYFYNSDYLSNKQNSTASSGILGGKSQYFFDNYIVKSYNDDDKKMLIKRFSSVSILPECFNAQGSHVGYTQVVEKRADDSFTIYHFSNFDTGRFDELADAVIQETRTPYEPYASKSQERGLLELKNDYDSQGRLVRTTEIEYEKDKTTNNYVRSMKVSNPLFCPRAAYAYDEGSSYKIYTYTMRPQLESEFIYYYSDTNDINGSEYTQKKYTYDSRKQISSMTIINPDNTMIEHRYKYPYTYGGQELYRMMVQINQISPIIEHKTYVNNNLAQRTFIDYKQVPAAFGNNYIYVPGYVDVSYDGSYRMHRKMTFDVYDGQGNVVQYTHADGIPTSYIWGYGGSYIVAKVENASAEVIKNCHASLSGILDYPLSGPLNETAEACLRAIPNASVTTFDFRSSHGVSKITDASNRPVYYEYDNVGRLYKIVDEDNNLIEKYHYNYKQ